MPPKKKAAARGSAKSLAKRETSDVDSVVALLKSKATKATRDGMARYGIPSENALGATVGTLRQVAKGIGRDHQLADDLWKTGIYEARMLATFVDDPALVTPAQMDRWRRDFDSWAICDTACFHLFDKTPHAWAKVRKWATLKEEFGKRAAFALIASLTVHDKTSGDEPFAVSLVLIENAASDDRNFVKKAVDWALRSVGKRSPKLHAAAIATAERLIASPHASAKWIGRTSLRELRSPGVAKRLAKKS